MSPERTIYVCSRCGHPSGERDHFCSQCGSKLTRDGQDSPRPVMRRERKIASVMFADVKGSTEVVSQDDPERASEWLERILDVMRNAVHRFGGTVNRVQGDGIMALFGAPVEYEDHSVRACAAALAMLDGVDHDSTGFGPKFRIRIGIASGEVLTLPVASDAGINYDAMGGVVHVAARLEQSAEPGSALISLETWRDAQEVFETRGRELSGLRGLPATVRAFELIGWISKQGVRPSTRAARPDGTFVNREDGLVVLTNSLNGLARKQGRVVFITGEAGMGKSRLIAEFTSRVSANVRICTSRSSPYRSFAYGPLADLVADLADIDADTPPEVRRLHLAALVKGELHSLADDELATLLDVSSARSEILSLAPIDRRQRLEAAALALLASISQEKALILLVEDLHWLDQDGLNQLARVCESMRSARCLVILTARDGWNDPTALIEQSDYRCHLEPLEPSDAGQLLDALVRPGRGTAALSREIVERTRGNPLFIEETLHALHQSGALIREDRVYSLQRPGVEIPLSPTVRGLLAARIDRLEDTQKKVLQAIAVIGFYATSGLLQSLLNLDITMIDGAIERLVALDLLAIDPVAQRFADIHLQFRHPLMREVTYEQTLLRDRVRIHRWMVARLEEGERSGLRNRTDILAEHAFRAEAWEKAANYMLRAGNEAFWRDAKTEAVRFLLRGLEAVERSGGDQTASLIGLQLRLELRNPLFQLARMEELAEHLNAARPAAMKLSDPTHTGRYHIFQSHYYWFTGDSKGALQEAEAADLLASTSGLDALGLRARFQRGLVHFTCGDHREAIAIMDEVGAAITGQKSQNQFGMNKSLLVTTLGYSARAHAELGQFAEAREDAARSLAIARELNNQFEWVFAYVAEGWVNFRAGDSERALPFFERAQDICATADVPLMGPAASSFLGLALLGPANDGRGVPIAADCKRALALAEGAVKQGKEFQFRAFQPMRVAIVAQALLANGRTEEALGQAQAALDGARRQAEPPSEVEALLALSQARHALGLDWQAALDSASAIAGRIDMISALNRCKRLEASYKEPLMSR
jgi:class 3 adenylate cyclase/tetratricopeptide (TPR) repeat protein